jgi:hypothetical protein
MSREDKHRAACCPHCVVREWFYSVIWRLDWKYAAANFQPRAQA